MSVLGLMESTADTAQTTPDLSALPSTNTERFGAAWNAAQTDDRYWNVQAARKTRADKVIDDLHAMTGERLRNPYDNAPTTDEIRENLGQPTTVIYAKRMEKLRTATRNAKAGIEQLGGLPQDYLDVDSIDADIASQSGAARARDERMSGTGGGLGGFLGSMAGETVSPHGIMTSFIPVTRMGGAVAEAGVYAFARNVAKEALFQGGTQGAAQSLATIVDYNTRKQFGTEQTNEQILEEIVSAFGGGALLGGAFRATHLAILKLASRGVEIPPAALDSARVMEERDLYGDKNPLRIAPAQMEVATDQATSAAALGRAASPNVDIPAAAAAATPPVSTVAEAAPAVKVKGLRVAVKLPDGTVEIGEPGHIHADLPAAEKYNRGQADWGFATPDGEYLSRAEAMEWVRENQPKAAEFIDEHGKRKNLEAKDYNFAKPPEPEPAATPAAAGQVAEAAPPVPAAEAEKAVADARLQGAAAAAPAPEVVVPPAGVADKLPDRAIEALANIIEGNNNQPIRLLDFPPQVVADLEAAGFAKDGIMTARQFNELVTARQAREAVIRQAEQAAELQRLTKSIDEHPGNPMQEPRPAPPEPKPQPTTAKLPGESAEDKAVLQNAKQIVDSEAIAAIDPEARRKMELIDVEEREYRAAVACVAGVL